MSLTKITWYFLLVIFCYHVTDGFGNQVSCLKLSNIENRANI